MILRELFYMDQDMKAGANDLRYNPGRDSMSMQKKDTRKTRLSLKQINELRKASEQHILEQEKELEFVEQMYKTPETPPA
jgi:flagellar motility protein MotE (MotC chaperone)